VVFIVIRCVGFWHDRLSHMPPIVSVGSVLSCVYVVSVCLSLFYKENSLIYLRGW